MIERGDVITIHVPYPSIDSALAYRAHMYVCLSRDGNTYRLVKCQTNKSELDEVMNHWVVEEPDAERNPFRRATRIDCDKIFEMSDVNIEDSLKTAVGVSDEVLDAIDLECAGTTPETVSIDMGTLLQLNAKIQQIQCDDEGRT